MNIFSAPGPDAPDPLAPADQAFIVNLLDTLRLVDAPPEEAFDKFTRLAVRLLDVPVALVSIVEEDRDRQFFKSQIGLAAPWSETRQTPLSHSFCRLVKRDNRPLIVEHAPDDTRVCDNPAVPELGVRAYLGVPFHGPDDEPLGALGGIDTKRRTWASDQVAMMTDLAACVTDQIRLRLALQRAHGLS